MAATKAAASKSAPPPVPRKTRATRATAATTTSQDADDLVEGLGKLNIGQKSIQPIKRTTKAQAQPVASSSTSKSTAIKKPTTVTTTTSTRTTTVKKTPASTSASKGKSKAVSLEDALPWARPPSSSNEDQMKPIDRVRGAMQAINVSSKSISAAASSGFKYTSISTTPSSSSKVPLPVEGKDEEEIWTNERIDNILETCQVAFKVLRELDQQGHLQDKALDVERSSIAVIGKCIALGMYRKAMNMLVASRSAVLRLYNPRNISAQTPAHSTTSTSISAASKSQPSSSRTTSKATSSVPARSRLASAKAAPTSECIPKDWIEMAKLPAPEIGIELSEHLRNVLFSTMMSAWVCLVALSKDKDELLPVLSIPPNVPTASQDNLHPLALALSLPIPVTTFLLHTFYRQVSSSVISPSSLSYLHLRHLALLSMAITISSTPTPSNKSTPTQFWDTLHRSILNFIREDELKEKLRDAAKTVDLIVEFVEIMVEKRGEKGWFEGKGWLGVVEMWVGLGRRLGDSAIIDKPLALLAFSTSIKESSPSPAPQQAGPSTPPSSSTIASIPKTPISKRISKNITNPDAEIARICGDLAKASLVIDDLLSAKTTTLIASITGLDTQELITLAQAIASLPENETLLTTAGKAIRAYERVRRGLLKLLVKYNQPDCGENLKGIVGTTKEWLENSTEFVEIIINASILDVALMKEVMPCMIDTLIQLFRSPSSCSTVYPFLIRSRRIIDQTVEITKPEERADWLRCLSTLAYNGSGQLYRSNKMDEATEMSKINCNWGSEALNLVKSDKPITDKNLIILREGMSKRWELLAGCHQRLGKKDEMFTAYSYVLAYQSPSIISQISTSSSSKSINEALEPCTELNNSLVRVANLILYEPAPYITHGKELIKLMTDNSCSQATTGAIGEKLMILLEEGEWKDEVAKIDIEIGDCLLGIYGEDYPIRRIRVLAKMMGTILTSGQNMDRFTALYEETQSLSAQTDLGQDSALLPFKAEYTSYTLVLRAMQAYHTSPHPSLEVIEASKEAIEKLRGIIIPPTSLSTSNTLPDKADELKKKVPLGKTTTTKAARPTRGAARTVSEPKKAVTKKVITKTASTVSTLKNKRRSSIAPVLVFDDLRRLTRLLGSLATLLGLLGHTLQRIEVLKLLRAFQRNKEDLVDDYIIRSAQLATEYQKLGKTSRAGLVFSQAQRVIEHSKVLVSIKVRVDLGLRYACYLALRGDVTKAQEVYIETSTLETELTENKTGSFVTRVIDRCETLERAAWARRTVAAIYAAQDNAAAAIIQLSASFRLFSRAADAVCRIASSIPTSPTTKSKLLEEDDPFGAPIPSSSKPKIDGADEPSKDSKATVPSQTTQFTGKHLHSYQWNIATSLLSTILDLSNAFAYRGTVRDCEYFLKIANGIACTVKSDIYKARIGSKEAELYFRMKKFDEMGEKLEGAAGALNTIEGPDMIDLNVLKGDLYSRTEMIEEAEQVFQSTSKEIEGLDRVFVANEAVLPTPRKNALLAASTSSVVRSSLTASKLGQQGKEPLLPSALAHVLRQYAWLLKEAGSKEECEELLSQIKSLPSSKETKAEELLLEGRIALHEAFNTFKTDLFMSSLTESAVAMPMGAPTRRVIDRQSTRQSIQTVLSRAEEAFLSALSLVSGSGKIEGIRQACLALALLRTFQTSLGQGSDEITASAAGMLASSSSITLQRELLEAIECKFVDVITVDLKWPSLSPVPVEAVNEDQMDGSIEIETEDLDDHNGQLRTYWNSIKSKYSSNPFLSINAASESLDSLPPDWTVISINVTDDQNTMFISRHQRNYQPIVFCLPLDRQGRREGEDDSLTFDSALKELEDIIKSSNDTARSAKNVVTREDKLAWWDERFRLDGKMKDLCESIEFVWLGAFKTIFSPRLPNSGVLIADLKQRLEKIFDSALSSTSGGVNNPRSKSTATTNKVQLDDSLLECFINLSSKCKDEEVEDLVYFILDVYQFHGVPVALSELDIDQIAIDVKGALEKIESKIALSGSTPSQDEHLFLALDKNIQPFPWESIPILRGRPTSRIPSLSFLLDQVAMGNHLRPSLSQSTITPPSASTDEPQQSIIDLRRTVNSRRTFYILNPSGDLDRTEQHFKPWIDDMIKKAGWKGIIGRAPTELELVAALKDYDLVLYFGHGGAEQYIRSHKIRHLPQCATTMLWGCSSGHLKEQGDLDRTGTAWHYMIGGCPSLTANLWDVTDRDIDRLSAHVFKNLHLDSAHLPESKQRSNTLLPLSEKSIVQAVNSSREECKLKYLTGAAPVVYGLPVWLH